MELKDLFPAPLNAERMVELFDNPPLLFFLVGALIWCIMGTLLVVPMFPDPIAIGSAVINLLFFVMICGSMSLFDNIFDDFSIDFVEGFKFEHIIYGVLGLVAIFFTSIIIATASGLQLNQLWWVMQLEVIQEPTGPLSGLVISFKGFAETIKVDPNMLQSLFQNALLIAPGEELVFRGVMTYSLTKLSGAPWASGVTATFGWAGLHMVANASYTAGVYGLVALFTAMLGGLIMLGLMYYCADISVAIGIHALFNCIVVIMSYMG